MQSDKLEDFKNRILFNEIHATERSSTFFDLIREANFFVKHNFPASGQEIDNAYMFFLKLSGGVLKREMLIQLCQDLKKRCDWKSMHYIWNDFFIGDETYYEDFFKGEIEEAKAVMKKLRPLVLEYTNNWTNERKQMDIDKPEGRFLKGWYETKDISNKRTVKYRNQ